MKLSQILAAGKPALSFEVFPPKTSAGFRSVERAVRQIAALKPSYMSVTYGAGGGTSAYTISIAQEIRKNLGVESLAHLTCVCSTRETIRQQLAALSQAGIENILALRGDIPQGMDLSQPPYYRYAAQLIADIRASGNFCIGGACYPEGHPESGNQRRDIDFLKAKVEAGCEFLTTQMFFDNNILYNFLYKIRDAGIRVPVIAGIMPVTNGAQVARICQLSGMLLPPRFKQIVDRFGDDPAAMAQAGVAYATEQIIDLYANGVNHVHVYSMNKPQVAQQIHQNLSSIIGVGGEA